MRRVIRRYVTRDPRGRPIFTRSERLTDDGAGHLHLNAEQIARWCSGCRRPVTELSELRGICDFCRRRECCVHCLSQCQVCSRRLCGHCRRGFAGNEALTVCAVCYDRLMDRQIMQDQLTLEQTTFDRYLAQQRLIQQVEALRQASERMQIMARFQDARLALDHPSLLSRVPGILARCVFNIVRFVVVQTYEQIRRVLP